jgi:RNA polymerase sigma factor (sigma-70 family)
MGEMMTDDMDLVREYARDNSEAAFATLVSRHINLVHSVSLRHVRDVHLAEDVTQAAFIILARKAKSLGPKTILPSWLCRTARYVSVRALTMQQRRQIREQEVYMQSVLNEPESAAWTQIAPLLDTALEQLGGKDHDAIVLRYFQNKSLREIGVALGANEDSAKKRVSRALEKLRKFFTKHGVVSTTAIIAGAISANSVQAAPAALEKSVTVVAITKGAAAAGSTLTLIKGAVKLMAWTQAKTVVLGIGILLVAGTGAVIVKNNLPPSEPSYQGRRLSEWLEDIEFGQPQEKRQKAGEAVRHMGVKTLPFLLTALAPDKQATDHRYNQAAWAFDALGPIAGPAIPQLTKLLEQNPGYVPLALTSVGPEAMPEILNALTNGSFWVRDNTAAGLANALYSGKISSDQAVAAFPIALKNLTYTNADSLLQVNTRFRAAALLGALKLEPDVSIPALMQGLQETNTSIAENCADSLSAFRQQAKPAIPLLVKAANSTNVVLSTAAKMALNQIETPQ